MYPRKAKIAAISAVILTVCASGAFAQTSKGILTGVARDATGAVLVGAAVQVTNQNTGENRAATTQNDGAYRIEGISPGRYTVEVTSPGFKTTQAKNLLVNASIVTSYNPTLGVGQANETVSVEANQVTLNTDNGTLSGVVGATEIDKLPIFSLNPVELATTVPGVQVVTGGASAGFSNGINIQVNGARARSNNFLLDGQEINDVGIGGQAFQPQIPDIFESVNVITNSASAEFGRAGGGVVNLVTKQGTNTFHGEVFERYTGSGLNARDFSLRGALDSNGRPLSKTRYDQHSYGFTAGGPIIKDKLFAFGGTQFQRFYGKEQAGFNALPDAAGYAALQMFTGTAAAQVAILDQYLSGGAYLTQSNQTAGQTIVNVGQVSPGCPATGCTVSFGVFKRPDAPEVSPDTQWMYRIDYHPREKDSLSFRYLHDRTSLTPDYFNNSRALSGFDTQQGGPTELGEGQWTHVFSPNLINEFRVSEARLAFTFSPAPGTLANPLYALPTFSFAKTSVSTAVGSITAATLGPNQNFPQGRKEDLYQFQDTVSFTKGRQSLRVGADIGRQIEIDLVSQNVKGNIAYAAGGTGISSLGNFLLNQTGPSGSVGKTFGKTRVDGHGYRNGFFAEDDVKLSADLTVNLGVRYDYLTNPENALQFPGVDVNNVFAPINTVVKIKGDYNNISPRLGFAYSPHFGGFLGDGKTVVRGGFGIFYDSTFSNILVNSAQNSPNAVRFLQQSPKSSTGISNPAAALAAAVPVLSPNSAVLSEASNLVNPQTYEYNLGIERQLPGSIVLAVRYVGNRAEKLFASQQYNYFSGGSRINPNRGPVSVRDNGSSSNYNAIEVDGTHNFSHGFLIRANYTYSKDLDNGSEIFSTFSTGGNTAYPADLSPGGRRQDYGPSDYNHDQYFSVAYVFSPKGFHSDNHFADAAFGLFTRHWTLSGVTQLQSGPSASFTTGGLDINGDGNAFNDRPVVSNSHAPLSTVGEDGSFIGGKPGVYYNVAKYNTDQTLVPVTTAAVHFIVPNSPNNEFLHQEIGRNSYHLPGLTIHNIALEKGIGLSYLHFERGQLILRAEGSNVFNHNDRVQPDSDVLDAGPNGFLAPGRGGTGRNVVLWAKFEF